MEIDKKDIKSITVSLGEMGQGDTATLVVDNKNGKYNQLFDFEERFSNYIRLYGGYEDVEVPIFTGKNFISEVKVGKLPEDLTITIKERNSLLEASPIKSEFIYGKTVSDLVNYCAEKYLGYNSDEIFIDNVENFQEEIETVIFLDSSMIKKLKDIAFAFGGMIFNDSYGNLYLVSMFSKVYPDIIYDEGQLIDGYTLKITALENRYTDIVVVGRERGILNSVNEERECCLGWDIRSADLAYAIGGGRWIPRRLKASVMEKLKGQDYDFKTQEPHIDFLTGFDPYMYWNNTDMKIKPFDYFIIYIPFEREGIPTDVDVKGWLPDGEVVNEKWVDKSKWIACNSEVNVDILGFDTKGVYIRVKNLPLDSYGSPKYYAYLISVFGNPIADRFIIDRGFKIEGNRMIEIYDENKSQEYTHFYASKEIYDESGNRLKDIFGAENRWVHNFDFITSDEQAERSVNYIFQYYNYSLFQIQFSIPFNPLLERGDLVRINLSSGKYIDVYVMEIEHTISNTAITSIRGFIKNFASKPWL